MKRSDFTQPQVKLDYDTAADGTFAGFDRFDRVLTHLWRDYGASADRDKFTYGYDRAGNRLYRENAVPSALDEYYTYDNVNRLTISQRGDLNGGKTAISGTPTREEDYTLDMTGNWPTYVQKTSGTTTLNQSRGHNVVNEVTSATSWATPAHDRAGNMTTVPNPSSLANGLTLKFDAWNRLVEVKDRNTVVGKYEYDAAGRRVKRHIDSQSPSGPNGVDRYEHLFYNGPQVIETRGTTTVSDHAENLQPKYQYVWSLRYIDAPVLRDENTDTDSLCDDARLYFLNDANMNVTSLVDTAGDALERYVYDPYGRVTIYNATWSATRSTSSYSNTVLYTGRDLDPESGLYFYRARYYSAELGRFLRRDPIEYHANDLNLYRYCEGDPINFADPSGLRRDRPQRPQRPQWPLWPRRPPPGRCRPCCETCIPLPVPPPPPYDPGFWNDPLICNSNNCYSYACNRPWGPDGGPRPPNTKPQPGGGVEADCPSVIAGAKKDGLTDTCNGNCPSGWHKVHAYVDPGNDYHWYRQDDDGSWSHKPGLTPCTNLDASGNPITDPGTANRNYFPDVNYREDCGELCAPN